MGSHNFAWGISIQGLGCHHDAFGGAPAGWHPDINIRLSTVSRTVLGTGGSPKIHSQYVDVFNEWPDGISSSIDVFEGTTNSNGIGFEVLIDDHLPADVGRLSNISIGQYIARFLMTKGPKPMGVLSVDVGALDIANPVANTEYTGVNEFEIRLKGGYDPPEVGDTLFISREAILVTAVSAASLPSTHSISFVRRCFGTYPEVHGLADFNDKEVFYVNPFVKSRVVTRYLLNLDDDTEQLFDTAIMEAPTHEFPFGSINCDSQGLLSWATQLKPGSRRAFFGWDYEHPSTSGRQAHTRGTPLKALSGSADIIVTRGEALVGANFNLDPDRPNGRYTYTINRDGPLKPIFSTGVDLSAERDSKKAPGMNEAIVALEGFSHFDDFAGGYSSHPFDIIRALLTSVAGDNSNGDYDVLPEGWGMGVPDELIDHVGIDALTSTAVVGNTGAFWGLANLKANSFLIADESSSYQDIFDRLLRPALCYLMINSSGQFTIKMFHDPGPAAVEIIYTSAHIVPDSLATETHPFDPLRLAKLTIGRRGVSGAYNSEIRVTSLRGNLTRRYKAYAQDATIDGLDYGNPGQVSQSVFYAPSINKLGVLLSLRYQAQNTIMHVHTLSVIKPESIPIPGTIVHYSLYGALEKDGTRGVSDVRGLVIDHDRSGEDHLDTIKCIDLSSITLAENTYSPAFLIDTFDIANKWFTVTDVSTWSDITFAAEKMNLHLITANGADQSLTVMRIASVDVGGSKITMETTLWPSIASGHIAHFVYYDDIDPSQAGYAHIADSNAELGTVNDESHNWGM